MTLPPTLYLVYPKLERHYRISVSEALLRSLKNNLALKGEVVLVRCLSHEDNVCLPKNAIDSIRYPCRSA
jgi:hypothetical protein